MDARNVNKTTPRSQTPHALNTPLQTAMLPRPTKLQKGPEGEPIGSSNHDIIVEQKPEDIPNHFKCPICIEPYIHQVMQCKEGHLICESCWIQLPLPKKCPSCRADLSYIRNRAIEDLVAKLPIQCRWRGCSMVCAIEEMAEHQFKCKNKKLPCGITECTWTGYHDEFLAHCKDKHETRIRLAQATGKYRFNLPEKLPSDASYMVTHNDQFYFVKLFSLSLRGFTQWSVESFLDGEPTKIKMTYQDGEDVLTLVTKTVSTDKHEDEYETASTLMSVRTKGPKGRFVMLEFI